MQLDRLEADAAVTRTEGEIVDKIFAVPDWMTANEHLNQLEPNADHARQNNCCAKPLKALLGSNCVTFCVNICERGVCARIGRLASIAARNIHYVSV